MCSISGVPWWSRLSPVAISKPDRRHKAGTLQAPLLPMCLCVFVPFCYFLLSPGNVIRLTLGVCSQSYDPVNTDIVSFRFIEPTWSGWADEGVLHRVSRGALGKTLLRH
ncbi:hypothetical protein BHM03_00057233, partial [Ensete ventricosum]